MKKKVFRERYRKEKQEEIKKTTNKGKKNAKSNK